MQTNQEELEERLQRIIENMEEDTIVRDDELPSGTIALIRNNPEVLEDIERIGQQINEAEQALYQVIDINSETTRERDEQFHRAMEQELLTTRRPNIEVINPAPGFLYQVRQGNFETSSASDHNIT